MYNRTSESWKRIPDLPLKSDKISVVEIKNKILVSGWKLDGIYSIIPGDRSF